MARFEQSAGAPDLGEILASVGEAAYEWRLDTDVLSWSGNTAAVLGVVAVDQARSAPALEHRGELPAEIDGIAHAGIHTERAGRRKLMHRVAREQHAALAIALGHQAAPAPDIDIDPFHRDIAPERMPQVALAVGRLRRHVVAGAVHHQPPDAAGGIDDAQVAPDVATVDHDEERARLAAALPQQIGRAEEHGERIADGARAGERDAQGPPHEARGAVAADQIVGMQGVVLVVGQVGDFGDDAVGRLPERLQPVAMLDVTLGNERANFSSMGSNQICEQACSR